MVFTVTILGCSSATGFTYRNQTSQVVVAGNHHFMIDCGEGTQLQMQKFGVKPGRLNAIFISHLHGDHYFGLMPLLSSMHLNGRVQPLTIYGPQGLQQVIEMQFGLSASVPGFPISFITTNANTPTVLLTSDEVRVESFPLKHRIATTGFKISLVNTKRQFMKEKLSDLPVQVRGALSRGEDTEYNERTYRAADYTYPPSHEVTYAYCSDTHVSGTYLPAIANATVLYHEATFGSDLKERADLTFHTTAQQAGEIALKAGVKLLIIGHYSSRYKSTTVLENEAASVFTNTLAAYDGMVVDILTLTAL